MNDYEIVNYLYIILASIMFSSQFAKYSLTNFKPLNCEYCIAFWLTILYLYLQTNEWFNILIAGAIAQLTKVTWVLIVRLYGNLIGK